MLVALVTGCSESTQESGDATASASASATTAGSSAVRGGGSIGAEGSACELPVTFDTAEKWTSEAVEAPLEQGPVALACEIDAKPAGSIGFLRVWTGKPGNADARGVLRAFVAADGEASKEKYATFTVGGLKGVEVSYLYTNEFLDETKEERALAVETDQGPVVLHLGGLDTAEHRAMLPAYELAKKTLRTGGDE